VWYFIFGAAEKSSLAQQFASEHKILHVKVDKQVAESFKEQINWGLVVESSATFFRSVESFKP
jgi:hypothetical protein